MSEYIVPFIIGGITVAGIKFLSNRVAPKYAALLGALPIGYISTYYIDDVGKTMSYLVNYAISLSFTVVANIIYYGLLSYKINKLMSLGIGFSSILLMTYIKLELFPKM